MNPIERLVSAVDGAQQRHTPAAFAFAVVKKFGDDRGSSQAALLTYYGFMSLFPALLVLTTILGYVGNAKLQQGVIGSTLSQFPVLGQQIGKDAAHPLHGNGLGLAIGVLGLAYGALGIAQAGQQAMSDVWNVPGLVRPGFFPRLVRSLLFFVVLGLGMGLTTLLSGLVTVAGSPTATRLLAFTGEALLNIGLFLAVFRVLTPKSIDTGSLWPGAVLAGIGYSILLSAGTALVQHQLRHAQAVYGQFGFVLGLIGWLYLVSQLMVYSAELNVVLSRRLWPRSIIQPPLTDADEQVLHDIGYQGLRRPEQRLGIGFGPDAAEEAGAEAARPIEPSGEDTEDPP